MRQHTTTVNRKWLHKAFKRASKKGSYFAGSTPREIAFSIVQTNDMHPAFVGKLDQLVTSLVKKGTYTITDGRLVRSDNITQRAVIADKQHARRQINRRAAKLTSQRKRTLHTAWHAETVA